MAPDLCLAYFLPGVYFDFVVFCLCFVYECSGGRGEARPGVVFLCRLRVLNVVFFLLARGSLRNL